MAKRLRQCRTPTALVLSLLVSGGTLLTAQASRKEPTRCTCWNGQSLEVGAVSYHEKSGREMIQRIEAEAGNSGDWCRALWVVSTEIRPVGTPYAFHLVRTRLNERRIDGCDYAAERFVSRTTQYEFVFGS